MSHNREFINNREILTNAESLAKGCILPIPGFVNTIVIDDGWCAVMQEGGAFKDILGPGTHYLTRYNYFRQLKATRVNMKINTMTVVTKGEFTIAQPVPVTIDLDLGIEYQVKDPRRVALEIQQPLTNLFDRVIEAVRGAVVHANVEEIRRQGEGIAANTLKRLQALQLPRVLGIEVYHVSVNTIKAKDTADDALAQQSMKELTAVRDMQLDNVLSAGTNINMNWIMLKHPELAAQIMAGNLEVVKELIDKGLMDPAGFLNQPAAGQQPGVGQLLGGMGMPGIPGLSGGQQPAAGPQLMSGGQQPPSQAGKDIHARMREEIDYLERLPGAKVETQPGTDDRGIPDGSYDLRVTLPRISGGSLVVYLTCSASYPKALPAIDVEVDGQDTPFQSNILTHWTGQYLVELVREVKQYFG